MKESDLAWDLEQPCANCPFRLSTPCNKKGISAETLINILTADSIHSCHKTDPQVTDGGFNPSYKGPVQACAGFVMMMEKSGLPTDVMYSALASGKLKIERFEGKYHLVHNLRDLANLLKTFFENGGNYEP